MPLTSVFWLLQSSKNSRLQFDFGYFSKAMQGYSIFRRKVKMGFREDPQITYLSMPCAEAIIFKDSTRIVEVF